jgi:hypothetical protein
VAHPPTARGSRLRTIDPLAPLTGLVALAVYLLQGFDGLLSRDLAVYSYGGQQFADGVAPFVAILNRAGPLAHAVPGVGAWVADLVGVDDLLGMRVTLMLVAVATIVVMYLLGRDLFGSRGAGLATAAAMLSCEGFIRYATFGPREKTTMVLMLALALLAMVHQRWGTSGAFIALSTLCWQPVAFPAIAGVAVAALLGTGPGARARLVALARIAVGGLVPTLVTVLAYVTIGKLQVFLDAFFWINLRYTQQTDLADNPSGVWHSMSDAYRSSLWTLLLGTIVILALGVHVARRAERRTARGAALVGLAVHVLVCVLWSFKAFNGWPDAFFVLPASMLGIGALVALLERRAPGRAAVAVVVVWALVATVLSVAAARYNRNDDLLAQRADVDAVMAILPRDATLASVEAPQPLVLAHRRNLSRFQLFGNGLADYVDDTWPGGTTGYGRWLVARRPTVIAVGEQSGMPDWLPPAMAGRYVDVGASDGWAWWVRRDLGAPVLDDLRSALGG